MQVTIEEAEGAQSNKKIILLNELLSDGAKDLIEMHDCSIQICFQLF